VLANITFVHNELLVDQANKRLVFQRLPVVNVSGRYHAVKQLSLFIADDVQLDADIFTTQNQLFCERVYFAFQKSLYRNPFEPIS